MQKRIKGKQVATREMSIDALYVEFLKHFYDKRNRPKAESIAGRLEVALTESSDFADSIRGEEIRSLIAELHGDFPAAIRAREAEIRKILELHTLALNTPSWKHVNRRYDFADVSDRLDLLAILYDKAGDLDRARATQRESQQYCESHGISFDGQEFLAELETEPVGVTNGTRPKGKPKAKLA